MVSKKPQAMNTQITFGIAAAMLLMMGCKSTPSTPTTPEPPIDPPVVVTPFDYSTVTENLININIIDLQGATVPNIKIALYGENPINEADGTKIVGIEPLITAQTDANGTVNLLMNIANTQDKLYLIVYTLGYINPTPITLNASGTTNVNIAPAGYVASKASNPTKASNDNITNTIPADVKLVRSNIYTLGSWDSNGVPAYRTKARDIISQSILQTVNAAVPEYVVEPTTHPEYFANPVKANIEITEDAAVWVTFISEGAGYRSSMGYFTYPTNKPPKTAAEITQRYVILPNCSFVGSGGGLVSGDKVQLVYKGDNGYTERFPAGTSIGWFVISDGFRNNAITDGNWTLYSFDKFNPGGYQQTLVLNDPANKLMYITFEDITRTNNSCDQDYNDVIFYCTASPYEAINQEGVPVVIQPKDTDGDGVIDPNDAYPTDPALAYDSYYPAKNVSGTLAYEDLWPATGDYDFNDLVVDVNFHQQLNAQNKVVRILSKITLRAIGASYHNGFAVGLNSAQGSIRSVSGTKLTSPVFALASNGTENGNSTAVIPVFSDGYALFGNKPYTNTVMSDPKMDNVDMNLVIELSSPVTQATLGAAPYDPFMVINGSRGREVHLVNRHPTALADKSLLGTENDMSSTTTGKYYISKGGKPWAIQIPVSFAYPIEKSNTSSVYLHFDEWAASNGTLFKDWYSNGSGTYRNASLIYSK